MTPPAGPNWSSSCAAPRSQRSASRRVVATSVVSSGPCSRPACLCARSIRSSCDNSPRPVGPWLRTIGSTRAWSHRSSPSCRRARRQAPMIEQLAAMLTVRRQLSEQKVATENASRLLEGAMLQRLSRRRVAGLTADIDLLDQRLVEIVTADAALAHRFRLLTSMPGVGAVLACTLIALLPELGQMSRKQVAALVGLAPYDFDSGKLKGRRCIWGGDRKSTRLN